MSETTLPEPWATPAAQHGITSARQLATRVGVHPSTVTGLINGTRQSKQSLIQSVAEAIGVDKVEVSAWARQARTVEEPWVPDDRAALLTRSERKALDALIAAITNPRVGEAESTVGGTVHPLRPAARRGGTKRRDEPDS